MIDRKSKLAVGTANFGLVYGAVNVNGRLCDAKLNQIMKVAKHSSVTTFDTAQGYGDSEERLGLFLNDETQVITKIGVSLKKHSVAPSLRQLLKESLRRLRCDQIYAVLLHHPEVLVGQNGAAIVRELQHLKDEGLVKKVGISIYDPEILNDIIKLFHLDIVQLPFNIFDRIAYLTGWAEKLKQQDIEIHARSVFLQGILLMDQNKLPNWFKENWSELFEQWFEYQKQVGARADEIALSFALQQTWIDKVVVGVDSAEHLSRLIEIEKSKYNEFHPHFFSQDLDLINPSRWIKE